MDEFEKCKKIQCKDGITWDIKCVSTSSISGNPPEGFILSCTSDGGEDISITAPKPLDMMKDNELCDLIDL